MNYKRSLDLPEGREVIEFSFELKSSLSLSFPSLMLIKEGFEFSGTWDLGQGEGGFAFPMPLRSIQGYSILGGSSAELGGMT
jgi:hypothetical protein